ncbi:hypothetical protein [Halomicronema sp. CCY15110]|uniref:hypothetical protein n=1 Tax=Halomicronema sp. CCY15110 TaxID=2767773 RepID=UPI00195187E8|nr:hypothetical protein [Halomicronema sp. CCY15110]
MKSHWLSWGLLMLAYATYGQLLHNSEARPFIWWVALAFVVIKASVLTLLWRPVRNFVLKGFKTDVGYSIMVLALASFAVLAVTQFRTFAYMVVLIAAALLVKVDCLVDDMGDRLSFFTLVSLSLIGLGISWLPFLLFHGAEIAA